MTITVNILFYFFLGAIISQVYIKNYFCNYLPMYNYITDYLIDIGLVFLNLIYQITQNSHTTVLPFFGLLLRIGNRTGYF